MSGRPLVSIITPCYNAERYIEENILSVAGQDYPEIEHIVVDGQSLDGTVEILKRHAAKICWKSEPDRGMYDAINKGISMASGDLMTYINADDAYYDAASVSAVVAEFERHPEADFVYGHCAFVGEGGEILYIFKAAAFDRKLALAYPRHLFQQPACFWRRSASRFFDGAMKHCADSFFFLDLVKHHEGLRIDKVIARFRVRDDSITFQHMERFRKEAEQFQDYFWSVGGGRRSLQTRLNNIHYKYFLNFIANCKRLSLKVRGKCYW